MADPIGRNAFLREIMRNHVKVVGARTELIGNPIRFAQANHWTANGSVSLSFTSLGPAGIGTGTIAKWLTLEDNAGTVHYVPAFT